MCGIAGVVSNKSMDPSWIYRMSKTLKHRGPDDEGYLFANRDRICTAGGDDTPVEVWKYKTGYNPIAYIKSVGNGWRLALAHRRLSILDLSPLGHQPMSYNDGNFWIVFNGEIYNYIEIREELKNKGYNFLTNTDTEVILASYKEWGIECLNKFNGMWAFVIYDRTKNVLFGARDRFGVKPFYYFLNKNYFIFASEIKALFALPFMEKRINDKAVFDYLVFGWQEIEEEGFFKGIFELQPSFAFVYNISDGSFKKWKYYTLKYIDKWEKFNSRKLVRYAQEVKDLIFKAVSLRMRSDVSIGTCLSGGLDSSTIVCVINNLLLGNDISQIGDRQKVFTASYETRSVDESKWAEIVVKTTKTEWHRTYPKAEDLLNDIEDLVYYQEIPFGSTSIYAQYRVMKLAKENGIKVLLDGQGGDELFAGYPAYYRAFFAEIMKNKDVRFFFKEVKMLKNSPINLKVLVNYLVRLFVVKTFPEQFLNLILQKALVKDKYINREFLEENKMRLAEIKEKALTSLNQMLWEYMVKINLKTLLRYEDRNSMRFSIEARTPFADDIQLIEYVFNIPSIYKIHNGWSKYLLREAMKNVLPEEIRLRRDKIGFATPEYFWLMEIKDELKYKFTSKLRDYINVDILLKDWDKMLEKQNKHGVTTIWRFINLAIWEEIYG
jgi:asparagine synthase (glutamine-hydrolysing)